MTSMPSVRPPDDEDLVAFVDNRLAPARRTEIEQLMRKDFALQERIALLAAGTPALKDAFRPMLGDMPPHLEQSIRSTLDVHADNDQRLSRRTFGLGLGLATLSGGILGYLAGQSGKSSDTASLDWRREVASYHAFYGKDTIRRLKPSQAETDQELEIVSDAIGRQLKGIDRVLSGYIYKRAQILSFDKAPLIQIVFATPDDIAIAFCMKRSPASQTAPTMSRFYDLPLASWTRDGLDELVVAGLPEKDILAMAKVLSGRA